MDYYIVYYITALGMLLSIPLLIDRSGNNVVIGTRSIILTFVLFVYLLAMVRSDGVDVPNYRYNFEVTNVNGIPDLGFKFLIDFFNLLSLPLEALFFFSGLVAIYSLLRLSRYFGVPFLILFTIYFFHLAVVRDFSVIRFGLSIAVAFIGLTSVGRFKLLLYIAAASLHLTSIVFVLAYEVCIGVANLKSRSKRFWILLVGVGVFVFLAQNISSIAFIDPRIYLYMSWEKDGYGLPVEHYRQVYLNASILILGLIFRKSWRDSPLTRGIFYLQFFAIISFFAFSDYAIFAFRLSSAISSLYPVFVLLVLRDIKVGFEGYSIKNIVTSLILLFFCISLLFRSQSLSILSSIKI